jgi:hypothetical protein
MWTVVWLKLLYVDIDALHDVVLMLIYFDLYIFSILRCYAIFYYIIVLYNIEI